MSLEVSFSVLATVVVLLAGQLVIVMVELTRLRRDVAAMRAELGHVATGGACQLRSLSSRQQ